jgi:hypothetical protein
MLIQLTLRSSLVFSFRKSDPIDQTERQLTAPPNPGPKKKKKKEIRAPMDLKDKAILFM